tara:strand:- start:5532 stop:5996 length:465 start_codon:yes stop_codon:yes gene_type:complete
MITDQYSSAEESDEEIEKRSEDEYVEYLKKTFSLGDFMECPKTRTMIKNEHEQRFLDSVGKEAADFYETERILYQQKMATLFQMDPHGTMGGAISSILYKHIKKDYDLNIFYEDTSLAQCLISYLENKKEVKKKRKKLPKQATATFNWATKKYE